MDTLDTLQRLPHRWPLPGTLAPNARLTWDQWRAWQARHTNGRMRPSDPLFGERELAGLRFLRWLYQTGRLAA